MNRWQPLLITGILLTGCSTSAEPDPEPVNTPTRVELSIPSYRWDEPVEQGIEISDPDGISGGFVRVYALMDSSDDTLEVFSEDLSAVSGDSYVRRWSASSFSENTPLDASGELVVEYSVTDGFSPSQTVSGERSTSIRRSRLTEVRGVVRDIFSGNPLSGVSVTLRGHRSVTSDSDGEFNFTRDYEVDADSLARGLYMALLEKQGYASRGVTLDEVSDGTLDEITKIPLGEDASNGQQWSYNTYLDHLHTDNETGAIRSIRWRANAGSGEPYDVFLYDESYISSCIEEQGLCRFSSTDTNRVASQKYLDNSEEAYRRIDELLPSVSFRIIRESESEFAFPEKIAQDTGLIYIAGNPSARFAITRANDSNHNGDITWAYAFQQTNPPVTNVDVSATLADGIENMGLRTTGQEQFTRDINENVITDFGKDALHVLYMRKPGSGMYSVSLDRADGTTTSTVQDYTPPQ